MKGHFGAIGERDRSYARSEEEGQCAPLGRRFCGDLRPLLGGGVGLGAAHSRAYAVALPVLVREVMTGDAAPARPVANAIHKPETSPEHARLLLSLAFATLAAINLGFWRHLRRVYASPRRRAWRRC